MRYPQMQVGSSMSAGAQAQALPEMPARLRTLACPHAQARPHAQVPQSRARCRMRARVRASAALLLACLGLTLTLASCGSDGGSEPEPIEGLSLSGRVSLNVVLVSDTGDSLGIRTYPEESGVRVYVERPDGSLDSTLTDGGMFHLRGLTNGQHRVWSGPAEARSAIATYTLTGVSADLGTIEVEPIGKLRNPPNPFEYSHGTGVEWDLATEERVEVRIFAPSATLVWSYGYVAPPPFVHVHWIGTDQNNNPLPPGPYWATAYYDGQWHSRVVIKLPE